MCVCVYVCMHEKLEKETKLFACKISIQNPDFYFGLNTWSLVPAGNTQLRQPTLQTTHKWTHTHISMTPDTHIDMWIDSHGSTYMNTHPFINGKHTHAHMRGDLNFDLKVKIDENILKKKFGQLKIKYICWIYCDNQYFWIEAKINQQI